MSYITGSRTSSMIARRPRAPVPRWIAWSAIASSASSVNSNSTPSISNSRMYCLTKAFFGSDRILTNDSLSRLVTEATTGRRPMNSGIRPNLIRSSGITSAKWSVVSISALERTSAPKPRPRLPTRS
ncbi:Uncharacterised protein [Mycobacterium tuberculosis]|nr:Uncharacterised protein [Mycobacterium tuberculosis]